MIGYLLWRLGSLPPVVLVRIALASRKDPKGWWDL